MSDLLTKLDIQFHNRVNTMQDRFTRLKNAAKSGMLVFEDDVFDAADDLAGALEQGRARMAKASSQIAEMAFETQDKIEDWRAHRETKKLLKEADKTQHYAEAAMDVAIAALDEAELALSHALKTRAFAEAAAQDAKDEQQGEKP